MIFVKARTKEDILNAVNDNPNDTVYGVTPSGNIYQVVDGEISQVALSNFESLDAKDAISKVSNGSLDKVDLSDKNQEDNTIDEKDTEEPIIENENLNAIEKLETSNTNENEDRLALLEKRITELEQNIDNIFEEKIQRLYIGLAKEGA